MKRRSGRFIRVWTIVLVVSSSASMTAASEGPGRHPIAGTASFAGSLRVRGEDRRGFRFLPNRSEDTESFVLTQLRLNFQWSMGKRTDVFVELQDARIFGERQIDEDAVPNIFADNLDVHQAFVDQELGEIGGRPVILRIGRQKLNKGNLRLIASLEWVNTARVVDGLLLALEPAENRKLELFASRLVPVDPRRLNDHGRTGSRLFNSGFHGAFLTDTGLIPDARLEAFALYRRERHFDDRVSTLGFRIAWEKGSWFADGETAWQFGRYGHDDHRARMFHAGAAWTTGAPVSSTFGAAYNFGSGDGDPDDGKHETFDNLYPLNHAYYGFMDFFSLQNLHNLEASWKRTIARRVTARVAWQRFSLHKEDTDAWYDAGARPLRTAGRDVRSHVGSEIDITFEAKALEGRLGLLLGHSRFFPGGYIEDTGTPDARDAAFSYLQAKMAF